MQDTTDWVAHTVHLPKMMRAIIDASNAKDYVKAMEATVEMRNELGLLKLWYIENTLKDKQ